MPGSTISSGDMMEETNRVKDLFDRLSQTQAQIALVVSGGGSGAVAACFRRSGASKNFVEAAIPYSRKAMFDYLGCQPIGPSASRETAQQLARSAHRRALASSIPNTIVNDYEVQNTVRQSTGSASNEKQDLADRAVGLALVAALPTVPPRDHVHQAHVAIHCQVLSRAWSQTLDLANLTARDPDLRSQAESIADQMIYRALGEIIDFV